MVIAGDVCVSLQLRVSSSMSCASGQHAPRKIEFGACPACQWGDGAVMRSPTLGADAVTNT